MENSTGIANWIRDNLKSIGKSQSDLARYLGYDPSIVNRMVNKGRGVSADEFQRINIFFAGANGDSNEVEARPSGIVSAYLSGTVEAGTFREVHPFDDEEFEDKRTLPVAADSRFPNARLLLFDVAGDSMNKLKPRPILPGDSVLCVVWEDVAHEAPLRDGMVVVVERSRDGGQTREWSIKQVEIYEDRIEFHPRSTNARHRPIVIKRDLQADDGVTVEVIALVRQVLNEIPID